MAKVYFGSVAVTKPSAPSTLPGKLQRILRKCNLPKLCSGDWVPVKMHLGGGLGYSTVHPLLVRMVTEAVRDAGGKPIVVDGISKRLPKRISTATRRRRSAVRSLLPAACSTPMWSKRMPGT